VRAEKQENRTMVWVPVEERILVGKIFKCQKLLHISETKAGRGGGFAQS
jgi:hypothetical protein